VTGGAFTSRSATRAAFVVIIVFVTAQMGWWLFFMSRYVAEVGAGRLASLELEAATLDALLELGADDEVAAALAHEPYLRLAPGGGVEVDATGMEAFLSSQRRVVRMFSFEGPFFVLVVMAGLFIIGRSLRLERELKRRQRNFLDAVGHEFKTPVSTLRLLVETLQLRALPPEKVRAYLRTMSLEVERIERTGEQVLATARLEAGAALPAPAPHDLARLVREALDRATPAYEARGAAVELVVAEGPLTVAARADDVATVVENLVDNAVKYTPGPVKRVEVSVDRHGAWARLRVEDRGSGVPEAERASVFDRFYRVGNELTRTAPGLGLGLYLVRRAVEAMAGRVRLEGRVGGGTVVTVLVPLVAAPAARRRRAAARAVA